MIKTSKTILPNNIISFVCGVDAVKIPDDCSDPAEQYNYVQDIFTSRRYWKDADDSVRVFLYKMLPTYIDIYMQYNPDLNKATVSRGLYQWL